MYIEAFPYINSSWLDTLKWPSYQICFRVLKGSFTENSINAINDLTDVYKIIEIVYFEGAYLKLKKIPNKEFEDQLTFIDSLFPEILSNALLIAHKNKIVYLLEILDYLIITNPLKYNQSLGHQFYPYKLKKFLSEWVLSMIPNIVWSGVNSYYQDGNHIITKENGIVKNHIINRNLFEEYLLSNTKLDTASSKKHDFAKLYYQDGELLFNLNLQIKLK